MFSRHDDKCKKESDRLESAYSFCNNPLTATPPVEQLCKGLLLFLKKSLDECSRQQQPQLPPRTYTSIKRPGQ